jgi:hypothetical protein
MEGALGTGVTVAGEACPGWAKRTAGSGEETSWPCAGKIALPLSGVVLAGAITSVPMAGMGVPAAGGTYAGGGVAGTTSGAGAL